MAATFSVIPNAARSAPHLGWFSGNHKDVELVENLVHTHVSVSIDGNILSVVYILGSRNARTDVCVRLTHCLLSYL